MIAHARHDENNKYKNGAAGDQTGGEVCITEWYKRPWDVVLRSDDYRIRDKIAKCAEAICKNDCIGYNQNARTGLYGEAVKVGYNIDVITKRCDCDCSSMVAVCVNAAGVKVSKDIYTGNEEAALIATGKFRALRDSETLNNPDWLLRGDILLYTGHHTAVNITDGTQLKIYTLGWQRDTKGWWYADTERSYLYDTWKVINHYLYHFDGVGYIDKGLYKENGKVYYLSEEKKKRRPALQHRYFRGAVPVVYRGNRVKFTRIRKGD